jgi:hypothetical protein
VTHPQDFREQLPDLLDEHAPKRAPGDLFARFARRMEDAPQRPGWATRERWLPMDSSIPISRAQRAALLLGTLLLLALTLAAAFAIGSRLLTNPMTIIVAADGSGDVTTLAAGIAMARDGDTILVLPGTYVEVVTITQDLELRGAGSRGAIVVRATDEGPSIRTGSLAGGPAGDQRYAILVNDAGPTISGLTFLGEHSAVVAIGGGPKIIDNHFIGVGPEQPHEVEVGENAIMLRAGSGATIRDNRFEDSGPIAAYDRSQPLIERNQLIGGAYIVGGFGDAAEIRNNLVQTSERGIESRGSKAPLIANNTFANVELPIHAEGGAATIVGNRIEHRSSNDTGIRYDGGSGTIEDNTIEGYTRGVEVMDFSGEIKGNDINAGFDGVRMTDSIGTIKDNRITAAFTGIALSGSSPEVVGNRIEGSANGVSVAGAGSVPTFRDNELCGTTRSAAVSGGAQVPDPGGLGDCREP